MKALLTATIAAAIAWTGAPESGDKTSIAAAVEQQWQRIAKEQSLWPGFDPMSIPLAVFDGESTFLFRHPDPPAPFQTAAAGAMVMNGRHPAVSANSSADLGAARTATLILDPEASTPVAAWAATAMHEAFHVFQRERHPSWSANEGAAFLYPVEDAGQLVHRRLETEALARALESVDPGTAACWARRALTHREKRFAIVGSVFAEYERRNELNEGLATYIGNSARGRLPELPDGGWEAEQVRLRLYDSGAALAHLLDRFSPGWKAALETNDEQFLDQLLDRTVAATAAGCAIPDTLQESIAEQARTDAAKVEINRRALRSGFTDLAGYRIRVEAGQGPLWPKGFDPWNTRVLDGGRDLLHTRMLKLGNETAELQMLNTGGSELRMITSPAGDHPLFQGLAEVEVGGLQEPMVTNEGDRILIEAPGFRGRFPAGSLTRRGTEWEVDL